MLPVTLELSSCISDETRRAGSCWTLSSSLCHSVQSVTLVGELGDVSMYPFSTSKPLFLADVSNGEYSPLPVGRMVTSYSVLIISRFLSDLGFEDSLVPSSKTSSSRTLYASLISANDSDPVLLSLSTSSSSCLFRSLEVDSSIFSKEFCSLYSQDFPLFFLSFSEPFLELGNHFLLSFVQELWYLLTVQHLYQDCSPLF